MTLTRHRLAAATAIAFLSGLGAAFAEDVTLTIESWRTDDAAAWQETIIPAFEAANPGIKVTFSSSTAEGYDDALEGRLADGSAGDLITCRPFAASLKLFDAGYLAPLGDLPGMENFAVLARAPWSTDDQATSFCVPMGGVLHGFIYNKDIFDSLGLAAPKTVAEFHDVLGRLAADGRHIPLAMGATDLWEAATLGYENIGPTYWKGETGRQALIAGKQKLTDENWVAPYRELARWRDYLGEGFATRTYSDSQNLFTLGRAAIFPAGSREIAAFSANAPFTLGAFPPPVLNAGDKCYVVENAEFGLGANARSPRLEAAKKFLSFVASQAFGELEANALPGYFPLSNQPVQVSDPLAQQFADWRTQCETTVRSTSGILDRGTPSLSDETRKAAVQVIRGAETPETVAARLQAGLDGWYKPAH